MADHRNVRITFAVAVVLRLFLDDIRTPRYGYELMRLTGFPSGKLYPILTRLEAAGWLTKERESIDPAAEGRPVRWFYKLSAKGIPLARQALAEMSQRISPASVPTQLRPEGA